MPPVEVFHQIWQIGTVLREIQDFTEWADMVQIVAMVAVEVIPEPDKLPSDNKKNFDYAGNLD